MTESIKPFVSEIVEALIQRLRRLSPEELQSLLDSQGSPQSPVVVDDSLLSHSAEGDTVDS